MSKIAEISEPASELERLIAEPVRVRAADLRLRRRLVDRAPNRRGGTGVPRAGRPALVARRARRRRGELDDGRAGR